MSSVTILIPTRNRPGPLARALESLAALDVPADLSVDVLVVDNAADGTAADVVAAASLPFAARCLREPRPGVSSARNAGVAAATGDIVAFVDDDCAADPGWLAAQVAALRTTGADGSFGPRVAEIDGTAPPGADFFLDTYSRDLGAPAGGDVSDQHAYLPLPGAAFVKARCLAGPAPFDPRLDNIGGEDVLLFRQLVEAGRRFVWAPDAKMVEFIPPARLDAGFILRRRYLSGQHRCIVPMMLEPPRRGEMLEHMAKGAVAAAAMAPVALAGRMGGTWPTRSTGLLMSGLGKLSWWRTKGSSLYGSGHR
ncbi:glycosyltransferase [Acuticoccus sp. MNP-M23]|uniref:glycosyltransferase family 2 protein n=1 Tax=Acuticoccus sp. MNP-M23 TaxID=3072793 RepID=UPI002814BFBA|nr:glycosyltransferase [Acuticoccus sp. MNP-M23]WMS43689.1 glycosyltransferase [Acuticoccus sp. MNP-M23]